jgi:spermidine synthase
MILPTICLGATCPVVGKICTSSVSKIAKTLGSAYAVNTIGAVSGSFAAGFILIPLLGKEHSLSFVIGLQLLTALTAAVIVLVKNKKPLFITFLPATAAVAAVFLCSVFPVWNRHLLSTAKYEYFEEFKFNPEDYGWWQSLIHGPEILNRFHTGELVYYGDGIGGFTTVMRYYGPFGNESYCLFNSGKADASSYTDMNTQVLLAHFPMLFHKKAKTVMVLGLGSGITAGETLLYDIERLDVLEISDAVVKASDFFRKWNNDLLKNPKTNLIIQDARAHLQLTKTKYDVIISEPSNPWMAGMANLFTLQFFRQVRNSLNPDGIFVQWLHSYQMNWESFSIVGRTFAQIFPDSILVSTALGDEFGSDYLFIGFNGKAELNLDYAAKNIISAGKSKNMNLPDPEILYRLIISEDLAGLFGEGMVHTDERPCLEFRSPRLMYVEDITISKNLKAKRFIRPETLSVINRAETDIDLQLDFAEFALSLHMYRPELVDFEGATAEQKKRFFEILERYCSAYPINLDSFAQSEAKQYCRSRQIEFLENRIEQMPDKALSYSYLAGLYYASNMLDEAVQTYQALLTIKPDSAEARKKLAYILYEQNRLTEAAPQFEQLCRLLPKNPDVHNDFGVVTLKLGNTEQAIRLFRKTLQLRPDHAGAKQNLAVALAMQKNL